MSDAFDAAGELMPAEPISTPEAIELSETSPRNGFVELGLAAELVQAVSDLGYSQPTPVQARAIPLALPADDSEHHGYNDLTVSS